MPSSTVSKRCDAKSQEGYHSIVWDDTSQRVGARMILDLGKSHMKRGTVQDFDVLSKGDVFALSTNPVNIPAYFRASDSLSLLADDIQNTMVMRMKPRKPPQLLILQIIKVSLEEYFIELSFR